MLTPGEVLRMHGISACSFTILRPGEEICQAFCMKSLATVAANGR